MKRLVNFIVWKYNAEQFIIAPIIIYKYIKYHGW